MKNHDAEDSLAYLDPEFLASDDARPLRIIAEYLNPLRRLRLQRVHDTIVFFGSARLAESGPYGRYYADARELARRIGTMAPGASVKLGLIHQGQEKTVTLTLGTLPNEKQADATPQNQREVPDSDVPKLGLTLAPASKVQGSDGNGVVVTAVADGGVAADHGFQVGDIILDVGGKTVSTPADVRKSLADARKEGKRAVLFRVKSSQGTKFVALPLGNA